MSPHISLIVAKRIQVLPIQITSLSSKDIEWIPKGVGPGFFSSLTSYKHTPDNVRELTFLKPFSGCPYCPAALGIKEGLKIVPEFIYSSSPALSLCPLLPRLSLLHGGLLAYRAVCCSSSQGQARWFHRGKAGLGGLQGMEGAVEGWLGVGKRSQNREDEQPQSNGQGSAGGGVGRRSPRPGWSWAVGFPFAASWRRLQ